MVTYFKKILVTILLTVLFLEAGLRVEGFVSSYLRERRNRINLSQKGTYRILCLGESMTEGHYPSFLEKKLNQLGLGIKFSVIDKGASGNSTASILANLESNLDEYHPDMVVAMMGFIDFTALAPHKSLPSFGLVRFLENFRVYKLAVILKLQAADKLQDFILERISRSGTVRPGKEEVMDSVFSAIIFYRSFNREQSSEEEDVLKKAIESDPRNHQAHFKLGLYYIAHGMFPQAESALEKSISLNPKDARSYCALGWRYSSEGKYRQAEEMFKRALETNHGRDRSYVSLGLYYRIRGNAKQAEAAIKKAIRINPQNYDAYVIWGWCYRDAGNMTMAEKVFRKALELNPREGNIYLFLAQLYQEQGKVSSAEAVLKKAIELSSRKDIVYAGLGYFYRENGRLADSEEAYKKALDCNPKNGNAYNALGGIYKNQHKFTQSEEAYKKALELNPRNIHAYINLGQLYYSQGKLSQQEAEYKKFTELNLGSAAGYVELGLFYLAQDKFSLAEDLLKKAGELGSDDARILAARSILYEKTGRKEAVENYRNKADRLQSAAYNPYMADNFRKMKEILDRRGVKLVCMQYPMRNVELLKRMFRGDDENVIFIDNEKIFQDAVRESGFSAYFIDAMGGGYGHCTQKGDQLIADNIAGVLLREVFRKQ